jgi:hypothetical protein
MAFVSDVEQKEVIERDILPLQIVDIEVALDLCNDIMAIINKEMDRLERSAIPDASDLLALHDLQHLFAHDMRSNLTRDNMPHVREFIATYAPQVKRYYESGEIPAFIQG